MQDDPFYTELATFIDVVEGQRESEAILSPYEDAIKTYELVRLGPTYQSTFLWIRRADDPI